VLLPTHIGSENGEFAFHIGYFSGNPALRSASINCFTRAGFK
jgi:hypothetical protein